MFDGLKHKDKHIRVALCFKDFACWLMNTSSVGLNVAGYTTAAILKEHGIHTVVFPVRHNVDAVNAINEYNEKHEHPLTHVVISAPWLSAFDLKSLLEGFPQVQFVILSHSNVGFLQADVCGVELLRAYQDLQLHYSNFRVGGNSKIFVNWMETAYGLPVLWLPNLYPLGDARPIKKWNGYGPLRIGAFGAVRPYKNFMTAAAAALVISNSLGVDVEFHMSAGGEGDGFRTMPAIEELLRDTNVTLITHKWDYWHKFIRLVTSMDLLLQVSYTESFNLVTADGIISGVPSVVSSAIRWAPDGWKADADNALDVASVGMSLLNGHHAGAGLKALTHSNKEGFKAWEKFLNGEDNGR